MKLRSVTKFAKENTATSKKKNKKKIDDDAMLTNCDFIVNFFNLWLPWSNLEAIFLTHGL